MQMDIFLQLLLTSDQPKIVLGFTFINLFSVKHHPKSSHFFFNMLYMDITSFY